MRTRRQHAHLKIQRVKVYHVYTKMQPKTDRTLVLDLDSCLLVTFFEEEEGDNHSINPHAELAAIIADAKNQSMRSRFYKLRSKGTDYDFCGLRREYLDQFLSFAFGYFKYVIVWSAGDREYVHAVVKDLFKHHHQPHYVLTRDDLVYADEEDYYKPLSVINKLYPGVAPRSKTVFIDDKEDNFREDPDNGFTIPKCNIYVDKGRICAGKDGALRSIVGWLMREDVLAAEDIALLDKSDAFSYSTKTAIKDYNHMHVFFCSPMAHS